MSHNLPINPNDSVAPVACMASHSLMLYYHLHHYTNLMMTTQQKKNQWKEQIEIIQI